MQAQLLTSVARDVHSEDSHPLHVEVPVPELPKTHSVAFPARSPRYGNVVKCNA